MRVLTRGDLDGLTSCVLLTHVESIREIRFAHPKDVQDGKVAVTAEDIVVNLPYVPGCGMWFDHHISQEEAAKVVGSFKGRFAVAPSCARVIYDHYRSPAFEAYREMLEETDRLDSANLTPEDILEPRGWILLGYTLDPRTGFGPEFQKYFRWLVEYVKEVPLDKVLQHPEVRKRVERVYRERDEFLAVLRKHSRQDGNVIVTDFRGVQAPVGNRFLVYTLYPTANVEARIHDGKGGATVNVAIGKSVFNRTCKINIGLLCHEYGGGGHDGAGTVQFAKDVAEGKIREIIARLKA
jgi:nanoRNase/pAp phosphatase (c-di-AMP/oligoRNAs hydrolase)